MGASSRPPGTSQTPDRTAPLAYISPLHPEGDMIDTRETVRPREAINPCHSAFATTSLSMPPLTDRQFGITPIPPPRTAGGAGEARSVDVAVLQRHGPHVLCPPPPDLRGEPRAEAVPPGPHRAGHRATRRGRNRCRARTADPRPAAATADSGCNASPARRITSGELLKKRNG
jgi:hypothetical protein